MIKDSISQRSAWCDHILPLTDGVFLTSALRLSQAAAPAAVGTERRGVSAELNIPARVKNFIWPWLVFKRLCYSMEVFIGGVVYLKSSGRGLQRLSLALNG